ncbi:hypothetical protein B0H14DRAFT_3082020 [Mycena olivaceomarginata]|nr:hypothetical protein B0H14DRAFT_3082020 [Mycena olivaceomarginata]
MSSRTNTVLTVAGLSLAGIIAYAVYFDYRRRTDVEFRKQIRTLEAELREALKQIKSEPLPTSEQYFMSQVAMGEQLSSAGAFRAFCVHHFPAALSFYRALCVYPSPPDLLDIYQKTVPPATVKVRALIFEVFPPKSTRPPSSETFGPEKVLVLTKDVAAGEEHPLLTCLDYDLQLAGTYCTHCLREIQPSRLHQAALEARRAAQAQLLAYLNKDNRVGTALMAKFIARQLTAANGTAPGQAAGDYTRADGGEYQLEDHVERWSAGPKNAEPPAEEYPLVVALLKATLPGLERFVTEDSHRSLLGRIAFNAFGVCFGGGRDDRPPSTLRPEDAELTRTPYGTARQVGTALYTVSAYLSHSCTSELQLIATKDLKKGDELSIAYVDVVQRAGESAPECRQRRRKELARGWKFACECSRCLKEASEK